MNITKIALLCFCVISIYMTQLSFSEVDMANNSDKVMEFNTKINKIQISMAKAEVIDILGEPLNTIDDVLYYVDPDDAPRVGHTTVVYKITLENGVVSRIEEAPGVDMTGPRPR